MKFLINQTLVSLADTSASFIEACYKEDEIMPLSFISLPAYTCDAELSFTKIV